MTTGRIERTAICYYDKHEDCFVVRSPLAYIVGTGPDEPSAWESFKHELEQSGVSPDADQRSAEVCLNGDTDRIGVNAATYLNKLARELGCSRGEAIEYLVLFHQIGALPEKTQAGGRIV